MTRSLTWSQIWPSRSLTEVSLVTLPTPTPAPATSLRGQIRLRLWRSLCGGGSLAVRRLVPWSSDHRAAFLSAGPGLRHVVRY